MTRVLALIALLLALFASPAAAQTRPNIVFVLTDDLSWNLVPYMPQVQQLQREGMTFDRYVVTDSLCCPSRASIFTGRYPHSTGVLKNMGADGGFGAFHGYEEQSTFATALQRSGYRTALFGKYLNGYFPFSRVDFERPYVPPGWSAWAVGGQAYREFDYNLAVKPHGRGARIVHYGSAPEDYLTDVISDFGQTFVADAVGDGKPFLLELSTYAPHAPYTPAPRDLNAFPGLTAPRTSLFDAAQLPPAPAWLSTVPLSPGEVAGIDRDFRARAQSVLAVDRMIGALRGQLAALGVAQNTYFVFSSDNGLHMGERRLTPGKQTAWDHDVRVPLIVVGPGVPGGVNVSALAANVDLRPTFQELAGTRAGSQVEGRSLVPFLRGAPPASWRAMTLVEHRGAYTEVADPDFQGARQGKPPSYVALRFPDALYVQFESQRFAPEYYDLTTDPDERQNLFDTLTPDRKAQLAAQVELMHACSGGPSCRAADASSGDLLNPLATSSLLNGEQFRARGRARVRVCGMRAIQIVELSGPESALRLVDIPEPGGDGVVIDVRAAGVSFPDVLQSRGAYQVKPELPFVPGSEVAGIVKRAGHGFAEGDRVFGFPMLGGFAEVVVAPAHFTFKLSDALDFAQGAGLILNYHTAYFSLVNRGRLTAGETVLVHGAAGGVGTAALQVAKGLGARTIAVVSTDEKERVARAAGADEVVRADGFKDAVKELGGADLIVDPVGGDRFTDSLRSLNPDGRVVVVGFTGGSIPEVKVNRLLLNNIDVVGAGWGAYITKRPAVIGEIAQKLDELIEAGHVRPVVGAKLPLEQAAEALQLIDGRGATGKVVLEP